MCEVVHVRIMADGSKALDIVQVDTPVSSYHNYVRPYMDVKDVLIL